MILSHLLNSCLCCLSSSNSNLFSIEIIYCLIARIVLYCNNLCIRINWIRCQIGIQSFLCNCPTIGCHINATTSQLSKQCWHIRDLHHFNLISCALSHFIPQLCLNSRPLIVTRNQWIWLIFPCCSNTNHLCIGCICCLALCALCCLFCLCSTTT